MRQEGIDDPIARFVEGGLRQDHQQHPSRSAARGVRQHHAGGRGPQPQRQQLDGQGLPFKAYPPRALGTEARKHEHIVIDTRGGLEDQDLVDLYDNSDVVVVPAVAESMTLEALVNTATTLHKHGRDLKKLKVLFTMARRAAGKTDKVAEGKAAVSELGIQTLRATIRATEAFKDACDLGRLVRDTRNPVGKLAWLDYERAYRELIP